ncbi:MAG: hypothetical protein ABI699_10190 [Caldimonas sp.]
MAASAADIASHLQVVDTERQRRAALPELLGKVTALKEFQQRRFSHTYADLLSSTRYGPASRYFLDELYGPDDFTARDAQFARVAPAIARVFPSEVAATLAILAELHALSETLDTAMGLRLTDQRISANEYIAAWQGVGCASDRERQIELTLGIAARLDRITRVPLLRNALRLMRGPARAAGLAELQRSLESGFDIFRAMKGAEEFIALIAARERAFAAALFAAATGGSAADPSIKLALAALPDRGRYAPGAS